MFLFLFLAAFNNFFTSHPHNENARLRLAHVIPIDIPITVANDAIKESKIYQNNQKKKYIY